MKSKVFQLPEIKLLAIAEDKASGGFLAVLQFRDIDGKMRKWMMPKAELLRKAEVRRTLENAGCYFSHDEVKNTFALKRIFRSTRDIPRWQFAASMGWYNNHRLFVLPRSVIGKQAGEIILKAPRLQAANHQVRRKGNLSTWKKEVAESAGLSSRVVCGICAAFGAVTRDFVSLPSFMINVCGSPKTGKSTALLVASSVYAYGREKDLPNFRTTDAAFGEIPAAFNHMMLPVNELGLLTGSQANRYDRLRALAYGFSEGNGTTYSEKYLLGSAGSRKAWQSIAIVNGEQSWNEIAAEAGAAQAGGSFIRLIDLPAVREGQRDIFDRAPESVTAADRSDWFNRQCNALRRACLHNHGHAINHFIRRAIKSRGEMRAKLDKLRGSFVKEVIKPGEPEEAVHLAKCFGHLAASGIIASRFKTVPWSEKLILNCMKRCYRDARRALRLESDLLSEGLKSLQRLVNDSNLIKVRSNKSVDSSAIGRAAGFVEIDVPGVRVTVRGDAFKHWFKDPRQPVLVLQWLSEQGGLSQPHRQPGSGPSITWAESQPTWPDGTRRRSIVMVWRNIERKIKSVASCALDS